MPLYTQWEHFLMWLSRKFVKGLAERAWGFGRGKERFESVIRKPRGWRLWYYFIVAGISATVKTNDPRIILEKISQGECFKWTRGTATA
jgi:hypothetical protein